MYNILRLNKIHFICHDDTNMGRLYTKDVYVQQNVKNSGVGILDFIYITSMS